MSSSRGPLLRERGVGYRANVPSYSRAAAGRANSRAQSVYAAFDDEAIDRALPSCLDEEIFDGSPVYNSSARLVPTKTQPSVRARETTGAGAA